MSVNCRGGTRNSPGRKLPHARDRKPGPRSESLAPLGAGATSVRDVGVQSTQVHPRVDGRSVTVARPVKPNTRGAAPWVFGHHC